MVLLAQGLHIPLARSATWSGHSSLTRKGLNSNQTGHIHAQHVGRMFAGVGVI